MEMGIRFHEIVERTQGHGQWLSKRMRRRLIANRRDFLTLYAIFSHQTGMSIVVGWIPVLCGQGLFWCSTRLYTIQVFIGSRQYPVPSIVGFKWNTGSGGLGSFLLRGGGGLLSTVDELDQCSRRLTVFTNMGNLNDTGIQSQWPGDSVSAWWNVIINCFNEWKLE